MIPSSDYYRLTRIVDMASREAPRLNYQVTYQLANHIGYVAHDLKTKCDDISEVLFLEEIIDNADDLR
ncbi:MAG: hypothetical protein WC325_12390, partial [Candidatus Bathyarchaeia archaeon]